MTANTPPSRDDPERYLSVEHLQDDLRSRSVNAAIYTLTTQGLRFLLHMGSVFVLARILSPVDFGLIGMVVAVTGMVLMFKDLGLSTATLQRAKITQAQVSNLFWTNVLLGVAAMASTLAAAPALAWFYGEPRLTGIALALAGGLLAGSLATQHQALLRRQMRFGALALVEVTSQALAVSVAVVAAWLGAGYWAIVLLHLALPVCNLCGVWLACPWRPSPPSRGSGVRPLLRFGGNLTLFGMVNYLARNLDDVLIGRAWGAAALGYYSRGYALLLMPLRQINQPLSGAMIAALSRLQDDGPRYRRYYLNGLRLLALVTMPLVAFLFALSQEIVLVVLGDQWIEAGRIFSVLAIAAFIQPVLNTAGWVYVSLGQADRMARWGALWAAVLCLSFCVGLPWGPRGVALSYTIANYVLALPGLWAAYARSPIDVGSALAVLRRPALVGFGVLGACLLLRGALPAAVPLVVLAGCAAASLLLVTIAGMAWPALRGDFAGMFEMLKQAKLGRQP